MTHYITWGRHPDYAGGKWIKLFRGRNASDTAYRKAQGFELRVMPSFMHPEKTVTRILTEEEKKQAFVRAVTNTTGAKKRWRERVETGLNDQDLHDALRRELGIAGGGGCRDSVKVEYQGVGLKIWASWQGVMTCIDTPIFEGKHTMAMARQVFGIANPDDQQISLFSHPHKIAPPALRFRRQFSSFQPVCVIRLLFLFNGVLSFGHFCFFEKFITQGDKFLLV